MSYPTTITVIKYDNALQIIVHFPGYCTPQEMYGTVQIVEKQSLCDVTLVNRVGMHISPKTDYHPSCSCSDKDAFELAKQIEIFLSKTRNVQVINEGF